MSRIARLGTTDLAFPSAQLGAMADHTSYRNDVQALRQGLADAGYLRLRGLIPAEKVLAARCAVAQFLAAEGHVSAVSGAGPLRGKPGRLMGNADITHHPAVLAVLEGSELQGFLANLLGEPVRTYDYKWLRAVPPQGSTGVHLDRVYMGRGSDRVLTCWLPFGDIPVELGTLAVLEGSHRAESLAPVRATYGRMDVDRDRIEGWFDQDPLAVSSRYGGRWLTADFAPGDVVVQGLDLLHASTVNLRDELRLSCDIRWQPATEAIDERWVGERPKGHYAWHSEPDKVTSMATMRERWAV